MRMVQSSLGRLDQVPSAGDLAERKKWFRHVVANQDIPLGTTLTAEMLECKRGEAGISPDSLEILIGRTTRRPLRENEDLDWDAV
jgi:sialic acid synthase SpsE